MLQPGASLELSEEENTLGYLTTPLPDPDEIGLVEEDDQAVIVGGPGLETESGVPTKLDESGRDPGCLKAPPTRPCNLSSKEP